MKTEHMKEFIELVRTKNYSRAADHFFLSQSALSKHILMIEEEVKMPLLDRSNPGVELTEAGKLVLEEFKRIIDCYEAMEERLHEMRSGYGGKMKIGLLYYATEKFFLPIIHHFKERYPNIQLHTVSGQPDSLYEDMLNGEIDACFLISNEDISVNYGENIELLPVYSENEVILCRKDNPVNQREVIDLQVLSGQTLLLYENGEFMKKYCDALVRWMEQKGIVFSKKIYIDNIDFISEAVLKTNAISIMPEHIKTHHSRLSMAGLKDFPKVSTCIARKKENANPVLDLFIDTAHKVYR